jgi:ABC-2 type transport system permease protein
MQTVDLCEVSRMLLLQLFWCIMLTVLTSLFWRISIRQITVNGG